MRTLSSLALAGFLVFPATALAVTDADKDGYDDTVDCNDADPTINPGATEFCDGLDQDCDGAVDDSAVDASTWYRDADFDGHGTSFPTQSACMQPSGYASTNDDCNDGDASAYPGAPEVCDHADNDCDALVDEGLATVWYFDADGDGYGDPTTALDECMPPTGYVTNGDDCDDANTSTHPGAVEVYDGLDNNCDGAIDEGTSADSDGDGYDDSVDCDPFDSSVHPGAPEIWDGRDNNCDGVIDEGFEDDMDGDGWFAFDDCDDFDPSVYPGAPEIVDGRDNDCDGEIDEDPYSDYDGDGYDATIDCDDYDPSTFPGAPEHPDGRDNDCDGLIDEGYGDDWDGDGWPAGEDCDDGHPEIHPGAYEHPDGLDNDCDGLVDERDDEDFDGDGLNDTVDADDDNDGVTDGLDCSPFDSTVYPFAPEIVDGRDNNCDGMVDNTTADGEADYTIAVQLIGCSQVGAMAGASWLLALLPGFLIRRRRV